MSNANTDISKLSSFQLDKALPQKAADKTLTIVFAGMLERLNNEMLLSVGRYFDMELSGFKDTTSSDLVQGILAKASQLQSDQQCFDSNFTSKTICCFDQYGQMLCSLLSFDGLTYRVALPQRLQSTASLLSPSDRVKLLSQVPLFTDPENHGCAELEWEDLVLPQMKSVLSHYEINFPSDDTGRDLWRRLSAHKTYQKTHGKSNKIAGYSFTYEEPFVCISIGSVMQQLFQVKLLPSQSFPHSSSSPDFRPINSRQSPKSDVGDGGTTQLDGGTTQLEHSPRFNLPIPSNDSSPSSSQVSLLTNSESETSQALIGPMIRYERPFALSVAEKSEQFIVDKTCIKCNEDVNNNVLTCYLCKLTVHYTCYNGLTDTRAKRNLCTTTYDKFMKAPNMKWFCNSCSNCSFDEILEEISSFTRTVLENMAEKVEVDGPSNERDMAPLARNSIVEHTLDSPNDLSCYSLPDYEDPSGGVKELTSLDDLKVSVMKELRAAIKEDVMEAVCRTLKLQRSVTKEKPPSPLADTLALNVSNISAASFSECVSPIIGQSPARTPIVVPIAASRTPKKTDKEMLTRRAEHLVDPMLSVIIKQVTNKRVISTDTNLKSEFNKLFNRMKVTYCKKTKYGNIILQLTSEEDVKKVIEGWKPDYFKDETAKTGTCIFRMKDQHLMKNIGIIHHVPTDVTEADLMDSLSASSLNVVQVKRIYRSGTPTHSCKATFSSHNDLSNAIKDGFCHDYHWLNVAEFKFVKRPMQCHGCKRFDHPVKWCRNPHVCGLCTSESHSDSDCPHKRNPSKYSCRNCQGNHAAKSPDCPVFKEKLHQIHQGKHYG